MVRDVAIAALVAEAEPAEHVVVVDAVTV